MFTLEDFARFDRVETQRKEQLAADLDRLMGRAQDLAQAMKTAAEAEDTKGYIKAEAEYNAIRAQIAAKEAAQGSAGKQYTHADVLTTWADYAAQRNAEYAAKLAEYEAARREAARLYLDLVMDQGRALEYRQTFARLAGGDGVTVPDDLAPLDLLPRDAETAHKGPRYDPISADALCYMLAGDIPRTAYAGVKSITHTQTPAAINLTGRIDPDELRVLQLTGNVL